MKLSILKPGGEVPLKSDNTNIRKPEIREKMPLSNVYNQVVKGKKGLKLIESVNNRSKANFVQRLNNSERQHIQDWENPNKIATHKMSWATEGEKAIVFPMVQEINGSLHDFSNPKYNHKKWDALNNAINKGDTLIMTPDQAKWFTENYKNFYPKFKKGGGVSFKSDKSTRQESDNTYVEKPRVEEPRERTVNVAKLSGLDEPDWFRRFKEIKTGEHQPEATNRNPYGERPLEQGLKNVYPEMALAGFIRSGLMGLLPSLKKSAVSTVSGITSREVKDKMLKGLEQATNVGGTINYEVRNAARSAVEKMDREVVKRLPERMQMPVSRTIKRGWNMATSSYGINGQIGTINDIVNE